MIWGDRLVSCLVDYDFVYDSAVLHGRVAHDYCT